MLYEIKEDYDLSFIKDLFNNKIPFRLYTYLNDEKLNPIKLDLLSYPHIVYRKDRNPPEILKDKKDLSNIYYKSARFLLARNRIYSSLWDLKSDRPIQNFESVPLQIMDVDLENLWCDREYLYLLEKV